jgi:hypothetical protein
MHKKAFYICFKNIYSEVRYECAPNTANVCKRYKAAWLFQGVPSSNHGVPNAAMSSFREPSWQRIWSLLHVRQYRELNIPPLHIKVLFI